mgnify:CR=1 FL=1
MEKREFQVGDCVKSTYHHSCSSYSYTLTEIGVIKHIGIDKQCAVYYSKQNQGFLLNAEDLILFNDFTIEL